MNARQIIITTKVHLTKFQRNAKPNLQMYLSPVRSNWKWWAIRLVGWLAVIAAWGWVVWYVYDLLRDVRDDSESEAIAAAIQAALAVATIILVWYTIRQVGHSREATERVAHDALLERLEARGPRAAVALLMVDATLWNGDKLANFPVSRNRYVIGDHMSLEGITLRLRVSFHVKAFGDAPVMAAAAPGVLADVDPGSTQLVEPGGDREPTGVMLTKNLEGEQIREVARTGLRDLQPMAMLSKSVVEITDMTCTVRDRYIFSIDWWPFERDGVTLLIDRYRDRGLPGPEYAQAYRSYDVDLARSEPPKI